MARLSSIYKKFEISINEAYKFLRIANTNLFAATTQTRIEIRYIDNIYESVFLKVFKAWEQFLEEVFIAYMTGAGTRSIRPKTYLKKIRKEHALGLLCGRSKYPDWTSIDDICKLAKLYFVNGRPFVTPLREIETYFNEMKKIRNAIVHTSSYSRDHFMGLVKARLSAYNTNITPGEFLRKRVPRDKNEFFEYYISFLKIAADKILPKKGRN